MKNKEKLIVKYLNNSISKEEWEELNLWFEQSKGTKTFEEYIKINYVIDDILSEFDTERTKRSILERIRKDKRSVINLRITRLLKYAAIAVILLGIGFTFKQDIFTEKSKDVNLPFENTITLEFENGNIEVISETETTEIKNEKGEVIGKQKGNQLIYNSNTQSQPDKLVYNQLTVPYGKKMELRLSDQTTVHLNSGSSLKYPVMFLKDGKREVFLTGEAFLDVAKDTKRPFVVNASDNLDIEVLGTQFNVSNYPEDGTTDVVLVEGSIGMQVNERETGVILEPGYKGSFDREQKDISTKPVITSIYTSWMQGELVFRRMSLEDILLKLERHYNVTITNTNKKYSQKKFNANFGDEPIEVVLNYFKKTYGINYTINANKVIIK